MAGNSPSNVPLSPNSISNIPLPPNSPKSRKNLLSPPPPLPKILATSLWKTENSPPKIDFRTEQGDDLLYSKNMTCSNNGSSSYKEETHKSSLRKSEYDCYQLPKDGTSLFEGSKCYELPDARTRTSPSEHMGSKSNDSSFRLYVKPKNENVSSLVLHQKKLLVLKSSENMKSEMEEGECSGTEIEVTIRKRKRSDDEDEVFTPKRTKETRFSPSVESPSRSRKSLPTTSYHSHISDRRRSFPYATTPTGTRYNRTDQTPYASPLHSRHSIHKFLPSYDASSLLRLESEYGFVDSHCHLDFIVDRQRYSGTWTQFKDENDFPKCYKGCLAVFCNPHTFSKRYKWGPFLDVDGVWASFGCHPHNASDYNDEVEGDLLKALEHPKVRALGEIGLDYSNRNGCMKEQQFSAFRSQLKIAKKKDLPVVIHCREANEDGMRIIKEILPSDHTLHLHCFTDTWEWAQKWMEAFPNLFVGITNVVTFPSARSVHEVAARIPLNRLLLETDAPYFVPRTMRGVRHSHPGLAIHVAAQIAAIRSISIEEVLRHTRKNTKRVYNI